MIWGICRRILVFFSNLRMRYTLNMDQTCTVVSIRKMLINQSNLGVLNCQTNPFSVLAAVDGFMIQHYLRARWWAHGWLWTCRNPRQMEYLPAMIPSCLIFDVFDEPPSTIIYPYPRSTPQFELATRASVLGCCHVLCATLIERNYILIQHALG